MTGSYRTRDQVHYIGTSEDVKPTNADFGADFREKDTLDLYQWDGSQWFLLPPPAVSGGGAAIDVGVAADLPGSGNDGDLYFPTDRGLLYARKNDLWVPFGPLQRLHLDDALPSTWLNQQTASYADDGWSRNLLGPDNGGNVTSFRGLEMVKPAGPFTLTVGMTAVSYNRQWLSYGPFIRDSEGGKFVTFGPGTNGMFVQRWTDATHSTSNLEAVDGLPHFPGSMFWARLIDSGSTFLWQWSADGFHWVNFRTAFAYNEWMTTPDRIGFGLNNQSNFFAMRVSLQHWELVAG